MADINVVFGADTTQLDAAVDKVKREVQSLVPGAAGSGILTPLPPGLGGPPKPPIPPGGGYRLLTDEERAAARAADELAKATNRAGIDFGAMAERMAARLVILEAIRLAIQGIKYAFDLISNLQQARLQFDAMADSTDHLAVRFQYLKDGAEAAFTPIEKAVQVQQVLRDFGASEDQAAIATRDLDKWAQILGVDAVKLAEALGRVSQGEGSLQDMRLVTRIMGEQSAAGRELIQTYVDLQKGLKNFEAEQATAEKSMDAVIRATERMGENRERIINRQLSITEKLANAQAEWDRKYAGGTKTGEELLTKQFQLAARGYTAALIPPRASQEQRNLLMSQLDEYKQGVAELTKTLGPIGVQQALRPKEEGGWLGFNDVIEAYKQHIEDQKRDLREQDEDRRAGIGREKTARELGVAGAKAEFAKVGPQAVTAPPAAQWEGFVNSLKGQGLQTKQDFDNGIQRVVDELGKVTKAADGTTSAVGGLENLFRGG